MILWLPGLDEAASFLPQYLLYLNYNLHFFFFLAGSVAASLENKSKTKNYIFQSLFQTSEANRILLNGMLAET